MKLKLLSHVSWLFGNHTVFQTNFLCGDFFFKSTLNFLVDIRTIILFLSFWFRFFFFLVLSVHSIKGITFIGIQLFVLFSYLFNIGRIYSDIMSLAADIFVNCVFPTLFLVLNKCLKIYLLFVFIFTKNQLWFLYCISVFYLFDFFRESLLFSLFCLLGVLFVVLF